MTHQGTMYADKGGASRFFHSSAPDPVLRFRYAHKASRREKEAGLADFEPGRANDGRATSMDTAYQRGDSQRRNVHPTVKPLDLCRWLATLLLPPPRADGAPRRILVPYSGSGSEMIGCLLAGWDEVVGVEVSPEYAAIAEARLAFWVVPGAVAPSVSAAAKAAPSPRAKKPPSPQTDLFGLIGGGG